MGKHDEPSVAWSDYEKVRAERDEARQELAALLGRSTATGPHNNRDAQIAALRAEIRKALDARSDQVDWNALCVAEQDTAAAGEQHDAAVRAPLEQAKNDAYTERNNVIALMLRMADALRMNTYMMHHDGADWEDDWRTIVAVDLPEGQCTWHIHDSEVLKFDWLERLHNCWDGHSTEEKYRRVLSSRLKATAVKRAALEAAADELKKLQRGYSPNRPSDLIALGVLEKAANAIRALAEKEKIKKDE